MYKEYINDEEVIVYDTELGLQRKKYQDNIKEIFLKENEIEILEETMECQKRKKVNSSKMLKKLKTEEWVSLAFTSLNLLLSLLPLSRGLNMLFIIFLSLGISAVIVNKLIEKDLKKTTLGLEIELDYLKEKITEAEKELETLKKEKEKNLIPNNNVVNLNKDNYNIRLNLEDELAFLKLYSQNKERYIKEYDNQTLSQNEQKLVRKFAEKNL